MGDPLQVIADLEERCADATGGGIQNHADLILLGGDALPAALKALRKAVGFISDDPEMSDEEAAEHIADILEPLTNQAQP